MTPPIPEGFFVVAQFSGPHGVRGDVKLKSFCVPPEACFSYGRLHISDGTEALEIVSWKPYKQGFIVQTDPQQTREYWASLGAQNLYARKVELVEADDGEYYHADLIGLNALSPEGTPFGQVNAVLNFGAGDILEILPPTKGAGEWLVPFTLEAVPQVMVAQGSLVVADPDIWFQE